MPTKEGRRSHKKLWIALLCRYYSDVFTRGRDAYAIQPNALSDPQKLRAMSAFFWWTAWAASTDRPGTDVSYTQNWPHEPLIGNQPTGGATVWIVISIVLLLRGCAAWCGTLVLTLTISKVTWPKANGRCARKQRWHTGKPP